MIAHSNKLFVFLLVQVATGGLNVIVGGWRTRKDEPLWWWWWGLVCRKVGELNDYNELSELCMGFVLGLYMEKRPRT